MSFEWDHVPDEAAPTDIYASRGYGVSKVGMGSRPAILVVDLQLAFTVRTDEVPWGGADLVQRAVTNSARLLDVARKLKLLVIHTGFGFRADGQDLGMWQSKVPTLGRVIKDSHISQIDPRVIETSDLVLTKHFASAFSGTPLISILGEHRIDTLVVVGCSTSGCIRATVVDGQSAGFRMIVPEDAVGDQDIEPHRANLLDIERRYGDVTTVDAVLADLTRNFQG